MKYGAPPWVTVSGTFSAGVMPVTVNSASEPPALNAFDGSVAVCPKSSAVPGSVRAGAPGATLTDADIGTGVGFSAGELSEEFDEHAAIASSALRHPARRATRRADG